MPSSLPRWTRTSASIGFLPCLHRPSPHIGRVGIHTFTFEACSRFTRVTACRFAAHPKWTSFPRASAGRSPYPTVQVATELNRQLLGRNFHPLAPYTLVAHQYVVCSILRPKVKVTANVLHLTHSSTNSTIQF
jgi:hypothetical protein